MSTPINYRETLVTYLHSEDLDDAASKLNITKSALYARLQTLKKVGVTVPRKGPKKGLSKLDVAQLNSLVIKYKKEQGVN